MQFTGIITHIADRDYFGEQNTPKITVSLEESEEKQYKDSLSVQFIGEEKCDRVDEFKQGDIVHVFFNTKSVASKTNANVRFNSINGWKIEKASANTETKKQKKEEKIEEDFDDLPF